MNDSYHRGTKLLLMNVALCLGTFIQVLDSSIANVAIPYIAGGLASSSDEGTWVITSFAASNAIVLPLTGWLSDYFGRVRLFVVSLILFGITSFLCGFSSSLAMLVFFRVLQGAVAGCLIPLSQSLLLIYNPPEKQGTALGLWGMVVVVAPILGPVLGGYITQEYTWPWIFYINVPVCAVSAFLTWQLLKDRESKIKRDPIDWTGLFLLALGVGTLQIMLDKGKDLDWFRSETIVALGITSLISLAYFVAWNIYSKYPIVNFSFFKDRNFSLGCLTMTIGYMLFFGSTVVLPLWLQTQQNYTAYWAGIATAPIGFVPFFFTPLLGKNLWRFDLRALSAASFFSFSISFFYQSNFTSQISIDVVMFARLIQGVGLTLFFIPLVQLSLCNISSNDYASASGVFNFIRVLVGSGFGTSLAIELWSSLRQIFYHARLSEYVNIYNSETQQFYDQAATWGFSSHVTDSIIDMLVEQQAYMLATNDLSWLAGWTFLLMVPVPFLCARMKQTKRAVVAAE